jgi:hypothetical protein
MHVFLTVLYRVEQFYINHHYYASWGISFLFYNRSEHVRFIDANIYELRYSLYMYVDTVAPSRELLSVVYGISLAGLLD